MIYCPECGSPLEDMRFTNPHNEKDEFCSDECSRNDRVDFCERTDHAYVLQTQGGDTLGVYTKKNLRLGVKYWMDLRPEETLHYLEWTIGYPQEPEAWDWCYISPDADVGQLESGGGEVPPREMWGKNLIDEKWEKSE